jgi:hypothetical protein
MNVTYFQKFSYNKRHYIIWRLCRSYPESFLGRHVNINDRGKLKIYNRNMRFIKIVVNSLSEQYCLP